MMQRLGKLQECVFCHYEVRRPCSRDDSLGCANKIEAEFQAHKKPHAVVDEEPVYQQQASLED